MANQLQLGEIPDPPEVVRLSPTGLKLLECRSCFYDKHRIGSPISNAQIGSSAPFEAEADIIEELDKHRKKGTRPQIFRDRAWPFIPWNDPRIKQWRDPGEGDTGLQVRYTLERSDTQYIIRGYPDEILYHQVTKELHIADIKTLARNGSMDIFDDQVPWYAGYRRQIAMYQWLLSNILRGEHTVSLNGCILWSKNPKPRVLKKNCGGKHVQPQLFMPEQWMKPNWFPTILRDIDTLLHRDKPPPLNPECQRCRSIMVRSRARIREVTEIRKSGLKGFSDGGNEWEE